MQEDRALLKSWRAGDGKAGEELFRRHFADVFRFFDSKVSEHAEELTQQTFVACLKSSEGLSREPSFRCFLFAIAWTALQRHLSGELNNEPVDFAVSSLNDITGRIASPSSQLHRAQQSQFVHQALARLPAKQQILLEYCYWHNLDDAALAEIFGVGAETIPDLLLRARERPARAAHRDVAGIADGRERRRAHQLIAAARRRGPWWRGQCRREREIAMTNRNRSIALLSFVIGVGVVVLGSADARAGLCPYCTNSATVGDGIVFDELNVNIGVRRPGGPAIVKATLHGQAGHAAGEASLPDRRGRGQDLRRPST